MESPVCNYAKGKWVVGDKKPVYSGFGCKQSLSGMWACRLTQDTDFAYEMVRWQPKDCQTLVRPQPPHTDEAESLYQHRGTAGRENLNRDKNSEVWIPRAR